ncbi:M1 family metallopeptidase [Sphingomonas hengshuiensis]|uniref:Aminopeptidase n=1 Tax=Sphingomonas hengshuiensis TaxID=1609977 RepID=A0A7U4LEP6_9SPHN|nr:M1 family metallopeptidase [Sphingomonas hengshuiensis]AJP71428.1 peptidase M1 [Sphingomonas hengshuiensis]
MRFFALALCAMLFPAAALAQSDAPPAGKLPDTVTPIAYRLDLTILPGQPRFSGHTEIDVTLTKPAAAFYMHGRDLHVTKATAVIGGQEIPVTFAQKSPTGLAQVDFGKTVAPGKLTLKFDYDAAFAGSPAGLYHLNIEKEWYSWTQFESIDARAAFPSFDEPGYKTPFTVSLTTKAGDVAISNAPESGTEKVGDLVVHRFIPTKPLPTYLIAFVVGPFAVAETVVPPSPQRKEPLPLRIVGTKPNADQLQYALDESGKIVTLLEAYFDQPFPYPKLDQIGSPVMPGAMENAGADIYGDGILFLDESAPSENKRSFGMIVAHELSHQWFGDLVTPAWWDDLWLNESFANWMGYRIGNEWRPDLKIGLDAIGEAFEAMDIDALAAGRPIHGPIPTDADINAAFDQITYGKGGQVVGMIAAYMGDTKFRDGVRLHMQRHMHGNATTDEFFASLAEAAKDPRVLASLRSFVDQQGLPVVTLHRQGNALIASQMRYAAFGSNAPAEKWLIPLCLRRGPTQSCTLVDMASQPVAANGTGPIMPNAGGWGYYRFELDPADWNALIAAGATLPDGEGLALNDSVWASFYAGRSGVLAPIALSRAMAAHPSTKVQLDNGEELEGLERRGLISAEALPAYRKLIASIYAPALAKLGFDPALGKSAGDSPDTRALRSDLLGLVAGAGHDPALRAKLAAALDAYLAGDTAALDPQYGLLAVRTTVEDRGVPFAKTLVEAALASSKRGLREAAFRGLSASGNAEVARWFLNDFKDPRLPAIQRLFTTAGFLKNYATQGLASDYMLTNFDTFVKAGGGGGIFSGRAAQMFGVLCTMEAASAVDAKLRPQLGNDSALNLDRSLDAIRNCARFREAKAGDVSAGVMAAAR